MRGGADRDSLGLDSLEWTVSDTSVARVATAVDSTATVTIRSGGTATVHARLATLSDSGSVVGYEEGELLASYSFVDRSYVNGVAVGDDGSIYLFRTTQLLSLDSDLVLRWERDVAGGSWMTPAIGPTGTIYVTPFRATSAFSPDGVLLWQDTTLGNGESAPAIDGDGNIYVAGRRDFAHIQRFVRFDPSGNSTQLGIWDGTTLKVPPVVVGDSVIVWCDLGNTCVGVSRSGGELWVDTLPSRVRYFAPSVAGDGRTVYLPAAQYLIAIDGLTGAVLNEWPLGQSDYPLAPIVDADGTVYWQTKRILLALNPDFSVKWQADSLGGDHNVNAGGGPALAAGGVLYIACGVDLCAVNTADGSLRWRRELPVSGMPGQIVILPDSSIVFSTVNRILGGGDSVYVLKLRGRFPLAEAPWPLDGGNLRRTRRGPG